MTGPADDDRPWERDPYVAVLCAHIGRLFAIDERHIEADPTHEEQYATAATDQLVLGRLRQAQAEHLRMRAETIGELDGVRTALALYLGMPAEEGQHEGRAHTIAFNWWEEHYPNGDGPSAADVDALNASRAGAGPIGR